MKWEFDDYLKSSSYRRVDLESLRSFSFLVYDRELLIAFYPYMVWSICQFKLEKQLHFIDIWRLFVSTFSYWI